MIRGVFLFLSLLFCMYSCKNEPKLSFVEVQKTSSNNDIVEINIPSATGDDALASTVNSEIETFVASLLTMGEPDTVNSDLSLEAQIEAFKRSFDDFINDFPESNQTWEAQIDGEVTFLSPEVISIAITSYLNTGGAHGNTNISFLNFDASAGKRIPNEKLFKDIEGFKTLAQNHFNEAIKDKSVLFETEVFELPANIGYTDEGIILLYNPYEIAPYAKGIIDFTIPFEGANDYLVFQGS